MKYYNSGFPGLHIYTHIHCTYTYFILYQLFIVTIMLHNKSHSNSLKHVCRLDGEFADLHCTWLGSSSGPHWLRQYISAPHDLSSSWKLWAGLACSSHEDGRGERVKSPNYVITATKPRAQHISRVETYIHPTIEGYCLSGEELGYRKGQRIGTDNTIFMNIYAYIYRYHLTSFQRQHLYISSKDDLKAHFFFSMINMLVFKVIIILTTAILYQKFTMYQTPCKEFFICHLI